jgi:hypothetical protein
LGKLESSISQLCGVLRHGQRVEIDDAEDRFGLILIGHPMAKGA